jgi:hypothetical protein
LLASLAELDLRNQVECTSQLQMQSTEREVICSIAKVTPSIERLLDTQSVIVCQMPALVLFRDQLTAPDRHNILIIVNLMSIKSEKLKQQLA